MSRSTIITLIFVLAIPFLGCDKNTACFKGTGSQTTEVRTITAPVEKIFLDNNINLTITQGTQYALSVKGGENLLPRIVTEVKDDFLRIYSENKCSFLRKYDPVDVFLTIPNITNIEYKGHGDVRGEGVLNFDELQIDSRQGTGNFYLNLNSKDVKIHQHTGPADFNLTGSAQYLYIYTNGNGFVRNENFEAGLIHVSCNGTGDVFVNPINKLRVELRYLGSVYYYGNPLLEVTEHTGKGEIKQL